MTHDTDLDDPDLDDDTIDAIPNTTAIARAPGAGGQLVPASLDEHIAVFREAAIAQIETKAVILNTVIVSILRALFPADFVANRAPDGQVTLFLQGKGAARARKHLGITVYNPRLERVNTHDPNEFYYLCTVDGRCRFTGETIADVEAGSASTDEVCKGKVGVERELLMRKSARTRADARATRILAGIDSLPAEYLDEVWKDTTRRTAQCPKGKGFGTRDARLGAETVDAGLAPPVCGVCGKAMLLRNGARGPFYSCADFKEHGSKARTVDLDTWKKQQASKPAPEPKAAPTKSARTTAPSVDEVFGPARHEREPGDEDA